MARVMAEDADKGKGVKFTKDAGFLPRSATAIPGLGEIPSGWPWCFRPL